MNDVLKRFSDVNITNRLSKIVYNWINLGVLNPVFSPDTYYKLLKRWMM